ncbi:MAG: hypothetical protein KDC84_12040 [Crocinitomicaceae bacterium]|nr:hypothetical protein [Crocinitomicaceae bacterium]
MGALKFRVVVDTEKEEDIFRDILINEELTFENLFHAIMSAFEFEGDQLASFYMSNDSWDKGREIGLMDMSDDMEENEESEQPLVMDTTVIKDVVKEEGQKLILVYDFLSMWCFLIELVEFSDQEVESAELLIAVGDAPKESDRKSNLDPDEISFEDFEDDFEDFDEDFEDFDNIDDLDI